MNSKIPIKLFAEVFSFVAFVITLLLFFFTWAGEFSILFRSDPQENVSMISGGVLYLETGGMSFQDRAAGKEADRFVRGAERLAVIYHLGTVHPLAPTLSIPLYWPLAPFAVLPIHCARERMRRKRRRRLGCCVECGYSLNGLESSVCPECGMAIGERQQVTSR